MGLIDIDRLALEAARALAAGGPQAKFVQSLLPIAGSIFGGPVGGAIGSAVGGLMGDASGGQSAGSQIGGALGSGAASQAAAQEYQQAAIAAMNQAYGKQQQTTTSTMNDLQSRIAGLQNPATAPQSPFLMNPNQLQQVGAPQMSSVLGAPGQAGTGAVPGFTQAPTAPPSGTFGGTRQSATPGQPPPSFAATSASPPSGVPGVHAIGMGPEGNTTYVGPGMPGSNPSYSQHPGGFTFNGISGTPGDAVNAPTLSAAEAAWQAQYGGSGAPAPAPTQRRTLSSLYGAD